MRHFNIVACIVVPFILFSGISRAQGSALSFDGTDRYVTVTHNDLLNFSNAFTIEAWIKTSSATSRQVIAAKMFPTTDTWLFELQPNSGGVKLNLYTMTATGNDHLSGSLVPANTWVHVAATYDGAQVRFYINGVPDGVVPQTGNLAVNTQPLRIGAWGAAWGGGDERRFTGVIDEVRLWSQVRSAPEIKAGMYGTVSGSSTGLVTYYQMNEGSGQTVADASANHLDAICGTDNTAGNDPVWTNSPLQYAANCLNFDSNNDYLLVPFSSSHDMTNALTMEAWIYPTDNGWSNILMKGNYGYGFALSGSGGPGSCGSPNQLAFWDQPGCGSTIRSALTYSLNTWQHAAVTVEDIGSQLRIYFYLNGVQDGPYYSSAGQVSNGGSNQDLYIGAQGSGCACNYFGGSMDELRLWNTVRSAAEIADNRGTVLSGTESGLALLFTFNQGITAGDNSGLSMAIDGTTNNNHGRLNNFSLAGPGSNWIAQPSFVLPVELLSFGAWKNGTGIDLRWSTAQEDGSSHFMIERSSDGSHFESIGRIVAAGNSNSVTAYQFTDASPNRGDNYYRLKQTDIDGRYAYSAIVKEIFIPNSAQIILEGNPVKDQLNASFSGNFSGNLQVVIADAAGAILLRKSFPARPGVTDLRIPVGGIKTGVYYLQVMFDNRKEVLVFFKR